MINHTRLRILDGQFSIHRLSIDSVIPPEVYESDFFSIVKASDEISIVCDSSILLTAEKSNHGWICLKFIGPLDFSLTGVLSGISKVLAKANISIFALSTYNTDYILVEAINITDAEQALMAAGYIFED